jgi:hypothetical protein
MYVAVANDRRVVRSSQPAFSVEGGPLEASADMSHLDSSSIIHTDNLQRRDQAPQPAGSRNAGLKSVGAMLGNNYKRTIATLGVTHVAEWLECTL